MSSSHLTTMAISQSTFPLENNQDGNCYLVIESQLMPDLLEQLYREQTDYPVIASKAFEDTRWADIADKGPYLAKVSTDSKFYQSWKQQCENYPVGCAFQSYQAFDLFLDAFRRRLTIQIDTNPSLFRFYEPRSLATLLTVLGDDTANHCFTGVHSIDWYDNGWYQCLLSQNQQAEDMSDDRPFLLTQQQRDALKVQQENAQQDIHST